MPEESSPVCPNHQREMLFDLLSEQYICPECQEERREAIRNARAQSPFTPEEAFPGRPEYARSLREKYMTKAFSEAWNLLKALPEQRVTAASSREGSGTVNPYMGPEQYDDRDIGTVHPAIYGMLQRLQGTKSPNLRSISSLDYGTDNRLIGLERDYNKRREAPTRGVYRPRYDPDSKMIEEFTDYRCRQPDASR
jgi:hypothetical protein